MMGSRYMCSADLNISVNDVSGRVFDVTTNKHEAAWKKAYTTREASSQNNMWIRNLNQI